MTKQRKQHIKTNQNNNSSKAEDRIKQTKTKQRPANQSTTKEDRKTKQTKTITQNVKTTH